MSLLAPLFLLGLLATALPWWLHRLSASNPPQTDFGSTRFLTETQSTSSKKRRTRYWWLLALRTLFLGLLCMLFAQPVIERLSIAGESSVRHIIVVDTSLSQSLDGRWNKTLDTAKEILDNAAGSDQAIIISASNRFAQANTNESIDSARNQLGTLKPQNTRLDYGRIASAVASSVNDTNLSNHLHIITDTQASALPDRFTALAVDKIDNIKVHSTADASDKNTSVTAKLQQSSNGGASVVAIVNSTGHSTGDSSNGTRTLQLSSNNSILASKEINVNTGTSIVHRFDRLDLSKAKEQLMVEILPKDSLAADDTWILPLPNQEKAELTILTGNTTRSVASTYVKAAIESDPRFSTRLIEADRFNKNDSGNLIIAPNAAALSDRAANRLREYVEEGGNLMVAVGSEPHSSGALALLGLKAGNQSTQAIGANIGVVDQSHQITEGLESNWRSVSVIKQLPLLTKITDRRIIDSSNGPLLLEKRLGSGKIIVLATALDTDWTDLPTTSVFVAFLIKTVEYLGGDIAATSYRSTGEAITVGSGAQILDPNGEPMRGLSSMSERASIKLEAAGVYQLRNAAGTQSIAVNSDPLESDITTIDADTIAKWQQMTNNSIQTNDTTQSSSKNHQGFWLWLLPLLLVVALIESIVSHKHLWIRREA